MIIAILAVLILAILLMITLEEKPKNGSGRKNTELYRKLKNASKKRQWQDRRENRFNNPLVKESKNPKKPP